MNYGLRKQVLSSLANTIEIHSDWPGSASNQYRAGPHIIAIIFMKGTKYDCNHNYDEGQI